MKWLMFVALATCAVAQPFSFGLKVGAPVTDAFDAVTGRASFLEKTHRLTIGPTVELRLPFGFGIEVDALYRKLEYNYNGGVSIPTPGDLIQASSEANSWEFPILAKYRGGLPLLKPFVDGGLAFNRLSGIKRSLTCTASCTQAFSDIAHNSNIGLVLGAGLEVKALLLKISPEIRYTRWGFANFDISGGFGSALKSNQNQAEVLVGITF